MLNSFHNLRAIMIDNFDSFTYNLVQYLQMLGVTVEIIRNDKLPVADVLALKSDFIVISPGPSSPDQAGICIDLIKDCAKIAKPLLGICLGHQAITEALGGRVIKAPLPIHGKTAAITHVGTGLFANLPNPLRVTRYHSLIAERETFPEELSITAWTDDHLIMGIHHKTLPIAGLQFHPESVLTENGLELMQNFIEKCVPAT